MEKKHEKSTSKRKAQTKKKGKGGSKKILKQETAETDEKSMPWLHFLFL
jgi:hypothetical protein